PGTPAQGAMANAFSSDTDYVAPVANGRPAGGVYGPPGPPKSLPVAQPGPRPTGPMLPPAAPYGPVVQLPAPTPASQVAQQPAPAPAQGTGVAQASYQAPAAGQTPQQLTAMLHDALFPSQREWAAEKLSALDWKQAEAAVQALTQAVKEDPAATVRASCIHALAKMKANSYPVVNAIQTAKHDAAALLR